MTDGPAAPVSRTLFVNGTVGSGKTTVLDHLGDLLEEEGTPFTLLDLDGLRRSWPTPEDDRFNVELELANLTAVARNALTRGPRVVVLAGVLEHQGLRRRYEEAVGTPVVVVRLAVEPALLRARLRGRYPDPDQDRHLRWHLARAAELDTVLRRNQVDDHVVQTGEDTPRQVAQRVLQAVGWR